MANNTTPTHINTSVTAVVVTHNRKDLLINCLDAISQQTLPLERIIVIDNASTDNTQEMLVQTGHSGNLRLNYLRMEENTGGAGGFHAGLELALREQAEWVWMMDDDALPAANALYELVQVADNPFNIYASVTTDGNRLSWQMNVIRERGDKISYERMDRLESLPKNPEVQFVPFLGFFIHTDLVKRIGLPDKEYFIAADDAEYCARARHHGAKIILATHSKIIHPAADDFAISLFGKKIICLKLQPWKRYYDTRNRLLLARQHYGAELYYITIPGTLVRMLAILWHGPERPKQFIAFFAGIVDGLLGRNGRRHKHWGIRP